MTVHVAAGRWAWPLSLATRPAGWQAGLEHIRDLIPELLLDDWLVGTPVHAHRVRNILSGLRLSPVTESLQPIMH